VTPTEFRRLFSEFAAPSWRAWNDIDAAIFGMPPDDADLVRRVTGRSSLPRAQVSEAWIVKGRGGGGSRFVSRLAAYMGTGRSYTTAPGERIYIGIFGPDKKQGGITFGYIVGLLHSVPALAALIVSESRESIELSNGVVIEVITASTAAPRGRAYALVIIEEAAFLPTDDSADPDVELLRAVRPALARVPGSLLVVLSSPYAMTGELYRVWSQRFGKDDEDLLVVQADTQTLNPSFSAKEIARAYRDDPVAAQAEYGAQFRRDVSSLLLTEALSAVTTPGVRELPHDLGREATAHCDPATGSGGDAFALAIAFVGSPAELALVRRWAPPFSPAGVAAESSAILHRYGVSEITIDAFAPGLVADLFARYGVTCRRAVGDTSAAFVGLLGLVNSKACRLLDDQTLQRELRGLERRTASGGRDRVGHGARGHDDLAAAAAFALVAAAHESEQPDLMLLGGLAHSEWRSRHMDDHEDDASDADVEGETIGTIPSALRAEVPASLGDVVRHTAARLVRAIRPERAEDEVTQRRARRRAARLVREREQRECEEQAHDRLRADASAKFLEEQVRQNGGSWFPSDR
jgi:hypothetical protein